MPIKNKHIISLHGGSSEQIRAEKELIESKLCNDPIFVFDNPGQPLYEYITLLHENGLKNKILYRLKICCQVNFQGRLVLFSQNSNSLHRPENLSALLALLAPGEKADLLFEDDQPDKSSAARGYLNCRQLQAETLQQLIYLHYPLSALNFLSSADMALEAELATFEKCFADIFSAAQAAAGQGRQGRTAQACGPDAAAEVSRLFGEISRRIARDSSALPLAVAGSKKAGKSALVNCLLGESFSPASNELPTPVTCAYCPGSDGQYRLEPAPGSNDSAGADKSLVFDILVFDTLKKTRQKIRELFKAAENNKSGQALPDLRIEHPRSKSSPLKCVVTDTPGPDLQGAEAHKTSSKNAIRNAGAAIFVIDYSKYLLDTELAWLQEVKNVFLENNSLTSLILAINKIDLGQNDSGAKSDIKSVDFIRRRFIELCPVLSECAFFPIRAQYCASIIELEEAAAAIPAIGTLLGPGSNWLTAMRAAKMELENLGADEDILHTMSYLSAETGLMAGLFDLDRLGAEEIRRHSGITQLANYAAKIMQASARRVHLAKLRDELARDYGGITSRPLADKTGSGSRRNEGAAADCAAEIFATGLTWADYGFLLACAKDSQSLLPAIQKEIKSRGHVFPIDLADLISLIDLRNEDISPLSFLKLCLQIWEDYQTKKINYRCKAETEKGKLILSDTEIAAVITEDFIPLLLQWLKEEYEQRIRHFHEDLWRLLVFRNEVAKYNSGNRQHHFCQPHAMKIFPDKFADTAIKYPEIDIENFKSRSNLPYCLKTYYSESQVFGDIAGMLKAQASDNMESIPETRLLGIIMGLKSPLIKAIVSSGCLKELSEIFSDTNTLFINEMNRIKDIFTEACKEISSGLHSI